MSENTNEIIENKKGLGSSTIFVMIVLALGVFMTAMDAYIFVPALPTIIADLQTSLNWATWTLTTYMLFMTAIMALAGKLSDVFGRKKLYIIGVTTFVIGSITASLSWDIYSLIASMGLQGIGAGIVLPSALSSMNDSAPENQRGKTMGVLMAMSSIATIVGPNIGGFLIQNFGWRTVFHINIPLGIMAVLLAFKFKETYGNQDQHIDYIGSALLVGTIASMLLGIIGLESAPFTDVSVFPLIIAAAVLFIALIAYEKRVSEPILDIDVLKKPKILSLNFAILLSGIGTFMAFTYVPTFAQTVLNLNVQDSGTVLTPLSVAVCITAILGGVLLDKFGSKRMLLLGSPLLIAGLFGLTYFVTDSTGLAICLAVIGVGVGFTWSAFQLLMMSFMPKEEEATGVGILNTFKGVGSTVAPVIGACFLVSATSRMGNLSQSFSNLFLFGAVTSIIALVLVIIVIITDKVDSTNLGESEVVTGK